MVKLFRLEAYFPCESREQAKELAKKIAALSKDLKLRGPVAFRVAQTEYYYDDLEEKAEKE